MTGSIIEESRQAKKRGFIGLFKNKKAMIALLITAVIGAPSYYFLNRSQASETVAAKREWTVRTGDIQLALQTNGRVVAEDGVELSFSVSGDVLEVSEVFVKQGDEIKRGDKIAAVKTDTLQFNLRNAYTSYQAALANYNERIAGPTESEKTRARESIAAAEISLVQSRDSLAGTKQSEAEKILAAERAAWNAKTELDKNRDAATSEKVRDTYEGLVNTIQSTSISLDGILKNSDNIIGVDNQTINNDFEAYLGAADSSSLGAAVTSYKIAKNAAAALELRSVVLNKDSAWERIEEAAEAAEAALLALSGHLYDMKIMLEATITGPNLRQSALDSHLAGIASNRSAINTKTNALNTAVKAVNTAKDRLPDYHTDYQDALRNLENVKAAAQRSIVAAEANIVNREIALEQARRSYDDLIAPLSASALASARSSLTSASINLERARLEVDKATIVSPIDGELAALNCKVGDMILTSGGNKEAIAIIINKNTMFIEVNIEEADIAKISVGQKAYVSFDALEGFRIDGTVSFISQTSSTNNAGIVTYRARVVFENPDDSPIREGMTAAVRFVIAEEKNVLTVPVAAVRNVEGRPSVERADGGWTPVVTGFTDGSNVEVISGISEGDKILY